MKKPTMIGAAAVITAGVIGGVITALTMGGEPTQRAPQEVRIVNETGTPEPGPTAVATQTPAAAPSPRSPFPDPTGTCTGGTVECHDGKPLPKLSLPAPPTMAHPRNPLGSPTPAP